MINPDNLGTEETPEDGDDEYFTDPDMLNRFIFFFIFIPKYMGLNLNWLDLTYYNILYVLNTTDLSQFLFLCWQISWFVYFDCCDDQVFQVMNFAFLQGFQSLELVELIIVQGSTNVAVPGGNLLFDLYICKYYHQRNISLDTNT